MKPKLFLRIAAGCLLFFALGHSVGHVTRHNVKDYKAAAVLQQMMETKINLFGQLRSYDEQYTGMSMNLIFTLVTLACILWILSIHAGQHSSIVRRLLVPMSLCTVGFGITSYFYFFPLPAISCLLAAISIGIAYYKLKTQIQS